MAKAKQAETEPLAARRVGHPPWQQLSGANILEHLDRLSIAREALRWHFRTDSKLWRAIKNHIGETEPGKCCIINKRWPCICNRGTGWSVSLGDVFTYADPNSKTFVIQFRVGFEIDDEDHDYYRKKTSSGYRIDVPKDLELNFTKQKFQAWLRGQKKLLEAKDKDELQHRVAQLVARYPEAKKFLKGAH